MSVKKKQATGFQKQLLKMVDAFIDETDIHDVDLHDVAAWAIANGHFEPAAFDPIKHLAREMQRASRQEYILDDNGEPVRRRHAYKIKDGDVQRTLWAKMEEISPKKMRLSVQGRRRSILADCIQLSRDLAYYNLKYNPGDPLQPSFNFEDDLVEKKLPAEYDDTAPPEGEDGDS